MLHNVSKELSEEFCKIQNVNDADKQEQMAYGLELILASIISVSVVIILSLIFNVFIECILFLCVFMPLRTYTGGVHTNTHLSCFIVLIIDIMCGLICMRLFKEWLQSISSIMLIVSICVILLFAPVVDKNHPMSKRQIKNSRKKSIAVLIFVIIVCVCLMLKATPELAFICIYALFSVAVSILIAKKRKEV